MLKISAISYLNTIPFVFGLKQSELKHVIELELNYPALSADKLINREVDIALVPAPVIKELEDAYIISEYCIGADGPVSTVCLYSEVPIKDIQSISLDYQSITSVLLLKILLKDYWNVFPRLEDSQSGFESNIAGSHAALVIGDRAFDLNGKHQYIYDLSLHWKNMTGLPFVFAVWVSNIKLSQDFIIKFNHALKSGLIDINKAIALEAGNYPSCKNPTDYLNYKISYNFDADKKEGLEYFLEKIICLSN